MVSSWSQEQAIQFTRDEPLSKMLKMSEKKQCYHSLIQDIKNEEIEEKRRKEKKIEEDFVKALVECTQINEETTFRFFSFELKIFELYELLLYIFVLRYLHILIYIFI